MAFGAELKDFVSGFKTGYDMVSSPEEKASRKAAEARAQGNYDRQGEWHDEDREYQRSRDAKSDERYEDNKSWQRFEAGKEYELRVRQLEEQRRANEMNRMNKEKGAMGVTEVPDVDAPQNPYGEGGGAIPDSTTHPDAGSGGGEAPSAGTPSAYLSGDPTAKLRGPDAAYQLVSDLQYDMGLPKHVAIGVTGALAGETRGFQDMQEINPTVPGSRGGYGFAQWTGPRRKQFEHYAGDHTDEYGANYGFLKKEMTNGPESGILDKLKGARTAQEAQRIFTDNFLRPGIPNYQGRAGWTHTLERALGAANGGLVVKAARGGMITDEHNMAIPDDVPRHSIPMSEAAIPDDVPTTQTASMADMAIPDDVPTPTPRPEYSGTEDGPDKEPDADADDKTAPWKKGTDPWQAGRDAVREGLKQAMKDAGDTGEDSAIQDPEAQKVHQAYIRGYGAAPRQMMKQVIDKIDPDRKMAPGERNMLAMGTVYKYYMDNGDTEQAKAAAASMVQYYRQQSQQFLALGQAAAAKGDFDNAAKAAMGAYANIPNGRDFKIAKNEDGSFNISVTDTKTGKVVNRKVMSPQEFGAAAMQFNPATFDDEILNAAGAPAETFKEQTPEALGNVEGSVRTEADTAAQAAGETNTARVDAIADIATSIAGTQENGMGPAQATRFAQKLASLNADDPTSDAGGFTTKPVRGNPNYVRVTVDGQTVVMSKNALAALAGTRKELLNEATEEKTKADASAKWKADTADQFGKAIDAFRAGAKERTDKMNNAPAVEDTPGGAIGTMFKPKPADTSAIPEGPAAVQPDVSLDERGMPNDNAANQKVIENLLAYRKQLERVKDDPRAARLLQQIKGRLNQLGYEE